MSEDEKKAIDMLEKYITEHKLYNIKQSDGLEDNIKILLDLYKQEKEKGKTLEELLQGNLYALYLYYKQSTIEREEELINSISKDKIKERIKELEKQAENVRGLQGLRYSESGYIQSKINVLKELIKEN